MLKPSPRAATYDVGEELQTIIKYLAAKLNVSTGTVVAMGVSVVEEAVRLQNNDCYVVKAENDGRLSGASLNDVLESIKAKG